MNDQLFVATTAKDAMQQTLSKETTQTFIAKLQKSYSVIKGYFSK
jgi:hypothetical protein